MSATYNGNLVNPVWSIVQGSQYASINEYGKVTIEEGVEGQTIIIRATYDNMVTEAMATISYDNQLVICSADTMIGTTGNVLAAYNGAAVAASWTTISASGGTMDSQGNITITGNGSITVQATYVNAVSQRVYTATKTITLIYEPGTSTETVIDPETGSTTTTESSTTVNEDGSTSTTESETIENTDGSSTSTSTTTNQDGSSSTTESETSAPDPETGAVTSNSTTTNYDENGDTTGSSENTTVENADGSSTSQTTNYNAEGDPTSAVNQETDTEGNNSTQDITYNESGEPEVTGYEIDTSGSTEGEKTFDEDGVNTEFYGFDTTRGFIMHLHFSIDFNNQPANQDEGHHNILTMKRATPEPWYGFQIRHSGTNKYVILGTQFATGGNTNTNLPVGRTIATNVAEYDIEVTYDPTADTNTFICRELINDVTVFTSNNVFPDIEALRYLTVCIGYALNSSEQPFRYSNINVYEFSITKLAPVVHDPVIHYTGQRIILSCSNGNATIYYKLNHDPDYSIYTNPIDIYEDTYIETYAAIGSIQSNVVDETCIYVPAHDYSQDYLTFRVLTAGTIMWKALGSGYTRTIEYSKNDGAWASITSTSAGVTISVQADDVVRFRGTNSTYAGSKSNYSGFEGGTAQFDIEGNIMSLIYGDNFIGNNSLSGTYNFCSIFKNTLVISAENLVLPTITLTNYCYRAMFSLCTTLVTPPALPATTIAQGCYWYMFEKCGISTSPDLLATTLVRECYGYMFTGCTSLNAVKCLATAGFGSSQCLSGWMTNVAGTGIFTKDAAATSWPSGNNGIPSGWSVISV